MTTHEPFLRRDSEGNIMEVLKVSETSWKFDADGSGVSFHLTFGGAVGAYIDHLERQLIEPALIMEEVEMLLEYREETRD